MPSLIHRAKKAGRTPFVRGVALFQIGGIIMLFTGLASSVLYARLLGLKEFGFYSIISASMGLLTIVTAYGQETAMATFLAEAVGRKDRTAIEGTLRYYAQATLVSTGIYVCLFILAPTIVVWLLHGDPRIGQYGRLVLLNSMLQPPIVLLFAALQIEHRIGTVVLLEDGSDVIQLLLCTVLLILGWGVKGILIGTLAVSVLSAPLMLWLYNRSATRQGFSTIGAMLRSVLRPGTGPLARQGLWIALDQNIGKNLYPNIFYVLLNATAPLEVVGIFRLAMRLSTLPFSLIMPSISRMTTIAIPRMAGENPQAMFSSLKKVLLGTLGLGLLAAAASAIVAPPLIPVVYGKAFTGAIAIFLLLLIPNLLSCAHVLSVPLLRVFRRVWAISITNSVGVGVGIAAYIIFSRILSPLWAIGISVTIYQLNSLLLFVYVGFLVASLGRRKSVP